MKIYHANFPFEIETNEGRSGFYAPSLKPLRDKVREIIQDKVSDEPEMLRFFTKPLDKPDQGLVTIEIAAEIEAIETVAITKDVLCRLANGGGSFVASRAHVETVRQRFKVRAHLFEET